MTHGAGRFAPGLAVAFALAFALAGCVPPPPLAPGAEVPGSPVAEAPVSPADAALASDAALSTVATANPGLPAPLLVHAPGGDVATLTLPDAVLFDFGIATPRPASAPVLASLARAIEASPPGTVVTVAGNTDAVGSDDFNDALSAARARNVVAALEALGVDGRRLAAIGFGRHRPVATNDTPDGRARNRRVEVALSPSFATNVAALGVVAPAHAVVPQAAVAVEAQAAPAPIAPRRPAPVSIHANRPSPVQPNPLGPSVAY